MTTLAHKLVPPWLLSTVLRAPVPTCSKTEPCVLGSKVPQIDAEMRHVRHEGTKQPPQPDRDVEVSCSADKVASLCLKLTVE